MSLYLCVECGCVENTALANYWGRLYKAPPFETDGRALCSECDPAIGKWHGEFEKKLWDGKQEVLNPEDIKALTDGAVKGVESV